MKTTQIFPTILIVLNLCSSVVCGCCGDWKKLVYWVAAAVLNITVTF